MRRAVVVLAQGIVFVPALITIIALHLIVQPANGTDSLVAILMGGVKRRALEFGLWSAWRWTFGTFGALLLLPFLTRRNLKHLRRFAPFIALVYVQLFLASDTERLIVLTFPAFIIMALESIDKCFKARSRA